MVILGNFYGGLNTDYSGHCPAWSQPCRSTSLPPNIPSQHFTAPEPPPAPEQKAYWSAGLTRRAYRGVCKPLLTSSKPASSSQRLPRLEPAASSREPRRVGARSEKTSFHFHNRLTFCVQLRKRISFGKKTNSTLVRYSRQR